MKNNSTNSRPPMTWHYYSMALGALGAIVAAPLAAWGAVMSGIGFAVLSHPVIGFSMPVRVVFLLIFAAMFVFAFPDAEFVKTIYFD